MKKLVSLRHIAGEAESKIAGYSRSGKMENADLEKFKERIRKEANHFHAKPFLQKGFADGERQALDWGYAFFMRYEKAFDVKKNIDNFTIEQIEELHSSLKSRQNIRVIRVDRIESGQGFEGVYRISEEKDDDPLEDASEEERLEYLKGWLRGIHSVWTIAMKAIWHR